MVSHTIMFWIVVLLLIVLFKEEYWRCQMVLCPEYLDEYTPVNFQRNSDYEKAQRYEMLTQLGFQTAKNSSILIAIMLRDMAPRIESVKERIYRVTQYFKNYRVLVVENNSVDDTRKLLKSWAEQDKNITILGCDTEDDVCEIPIASIKTVGHAVYYRRIAKMVYLRNIYLDEIKRIGNNYDYTLVWDVDVIGSLYSDGLANSLGWMTKNPKIEMISAYGAYRKFGRWIYYDTYAHQDLGEHFNFKRKLRHDFEKGVFTQYTIGDDLLQVESGFGGCTLYKTSVLLPPHVKYTMSTDDNIECEHTRLHYHLKQKYMNPSMINLILYNP